MSLCLMLLDRELFAAELKIMFLPLRDTCGGIMMTKFLCSIVKWSYQSYNGYENRTKIPYRNSTVSMGGTLLGVRLTQIYYTCISSVGVG